MDQIFESLEENMRLNRVKQCVEELEYLSYYLDKLQFSNSIAQTFVKVMSLFARDNWEMFTTFYKMMFSVMFSNKECQELLVLSYAALLKYLQSNKVHEVDASLTMLANAPFWKTDVSYFPDILKSIECTPNQSIHILKKVAMGWRTCFRKEKFAGIDLNSINDCLERMRQFKGKEEQITIFNMSCGLIADTPLKQIIPNQLLFSLLTDFHAQFKPEMVIHFCKLLNYIGYEKKEIFSCSSLQLCQVINKTEENLFSSSTQSFKYAPLLVELFGICLSLEKEDTSLFSCLSRVTKRILLINPQETSEDYDMEESHYVIKNIKASFLSRLKSSGATSVFLDFLREKIFVGEDWAHKLKWEEFFVLEKCLCKSVIFPLIESKSVFKFAFNVNSLAVFFERQLSEGGGVEVTLHYGNFSRFTIEDFQVKVSLDREYEGTLLPLSSQDKKIPPLSIGEQSQKLEIKRKNSKVKENSLQGEKEEELSFLMLFEYNQLSNSFSHHQIMIVN